jgi:flagellar protein FlaF
MTVAAYQTALRTTENPRDAEYRLFAQVTRALMGARDRLQNSEKGEAFYQALSWNREMWQTLALDVRHPGNQLPDRLKAQFVSLAIWVDKHTVRVMRGDASIDALIEVNRTVMAGLAP